MRRQMSKKCFRFAEGVNVKPEESRTLAMDLRTDASSSTRQTTGARPGMLLNYHSRSSQCYETLAVDLTPGGTSALCIMPISQLPM